MILNLTDLSNESLQNQIARQIRAKVLGGDLDAGENLPSIRALAREQQVSVITVQRAYEMLERDGLIHSRRGKGFFVSDLTERARKAIARERLIDSMRPQLQAAVAEGLDTNDINAVIAHILNDENAEL